MREQIHLDNLEQLQVAWMHRTEYQFSARQSLQAPALDSPRSLRACELCGIDPAVDLELRSLKQHFELVANLPYVDDSIFTDFDTSEALNACKEAGIVSGSIQQRVLAYRNYVHFERLRVDALGWAQGVRHKIIAEESSRRRRRQRRVQEDKRLCYFSYVETRPLEERHVYPAQERPGGATVGAVVAMVVAPPVNIKAEEGEVLPRAGAGSECISTADADVFATGKKTSLRGCSSLVAGDGETSAVKGHQSRAAAELREEGAAAAVLAATGGAVAAAATKTDGAFEQLARGTGEGAPPAPLIFSKEQSEVFYYYCANAVAAGRVSECTEQSII